jgi:hypothetical protein
MTASSQTRHNMLCNSNVHCHVHRKPPLIPILNQSIALQPISLRPILILQTHLGLCIHNRLYLSGSTTSILYTFLLSPFVLHALPAHSIWLFQLYLSESTSYEALNYVIFSTSYHFTLFSPNVLPCVLFSNILSLCKIWGFRGGDYEEWCLLGCYAVWLL